MGDCLRRFCFRIGGGVTPATRDSATAVASSPLQTTPAWITSAAGNRVDPSNDDPAVNACFAHSTRVGHISHIRRAARTALSGAVAGDVNARLRVRWQGFINVAARMAQTVAQVGLRAGGQLASLLPMSTDKELSKMTKAELVAYAARLQDKQASEMVAVNTRLPRHLRDDMRTAADELGMTLRGVIEEACSLWLDQRGAEKS